MMSAPSETVESEHRFSGSRSKLGVAILALIPVFACFLGGATQKWAEGIIVLILGGYLIIGPPRLSLGWGLNIVCIGLLGCAALALLPARWFFWPAWRTA